MLALWCLKALCKAFYIGKGPNDSCNVDGVEGILSVCKLIEVILEPSERCFEAYL